MLADNLGLPPDNSEETIMTIDQTTRTAPRTSQLDRELAMRLAATEYDQVADLLERLTPEQWSAPTDCPGWDVRAMAGHMLGMAQMAASLREMVRQQRAAARRQKQRRRPEHRRAHGCSGGQERRSHHRGGGRRDARGRSEGRPRAAAYSRPRPEPHHARAPGRGGRGGALDRSDSCLDTILTRDPFMHRIDICRATGLPLDATADHEGHIVEDVVREWAERHGAALRARADRAGRRALGGGQR